MKIAITGASGFIGKMLVDKHLKMGDEVRVLTRKKSNIFVSSDKLKVYIGDLRDVNSLINFVMGVDVLYHCAAEIVDEKMMQSVNVDGTRYLIQAASGNIKHWVQLSSVGVYGPIFEGTVYENQAYHPINQYEKTKLKSDLLVVDAAENHHFSYTLVRPSNVIGVQMKNQSIFQLIKMIDRGLYFFLGAKGASANYVSVDNVVEALYLAGTKAESRNEIFMVSSWCTIEDFVGFIAKALDKPVPKIRIPVGLMKFIARATSFVPSNPLTLARVQALSNKSVYDISRIETKLGYQSVVSTEETITKMVLALKNKR